MIRWGIIGTGNIAERFIASLSHSQRGKLTAIASRKAATRERFADLTTYADYEALLNDPNIDAVYIGLPHRFHAEWSIRALKHRKAVLCEKPAVLTIEEMASVQAAAQANGTFYMEAMKTRFTGAFERLGEVVEAGRIGELRRIEAAFCSDSAICGKVPPTSYLFERGQGGSWNDVSAYLIAFTLRFFEGLPIKIEAQANMKNGIDFSTVAHLEFAGGKIAQLETAIDHKKERTAVLIGERGVIRAPIFNRMEELEIIQDGRSETIRIPLEYDDFFGQIEEVHRCLEAGLIESPRYPLDEICREIEVMQAVREIAQNS